MLTGKQRAYLRGLGNKFESILHLGKGEITPAIIKQADDALTARELIKGKVLETSELSSREAAEKIAFKVKAEVVHVIGRTFLLYRKNQKEPKIVLPKAKK